MGQYYGLNNYTLHPRTIEWDPRKGPKITLPYVGTPGAIDSLVLSLIANGKRFTRTARPDGGYSLLSVFVGAEDTQSPDEPLAVLWDLDGNDIEKSLWEHPRTKAIFATWVDADGFPTQTYTTVRRDVMDVVSGAKTINDISFWPTADAEFKKFLTAMLRGQDSYWLSTWVLRKRVIIAKGSRIKPSLLNIDKVFTTTTQLTTMEAIPGALLFDLPEGVWLKKSPKLDQIAADKWQISQEYYWADEYSDFSYKPAA